MTVLDVSDAVYVHDVDGLRALPAGTLLSSQRDRAWLVTDDEMLRWCTLDGEPVGRLKPRSMGPIFFAGVYPGQRIVRRVLNPEILGFDDEPCEHLSWTGIDTTPIDDPAKLWRCDVCDVVETTSSGALASPLIAPAGLAQRIIDRLVAPDNVDCEPLDDPQPLLSPRLRYWLGVTLSAALGLVIVWAAASLLLNL